MGRKCAVPHCYTGYRKCKEKATLYRVPDNDFFLNKWQEAIAREDRPITPKDSVCEKHFRDEDIIRRRTIKNTVEMYQRPRLKPDAIPSIFPELPKFILKMVKKRRKMPIEQQQNSSTNITNEAVQNYNAHQLEIKPEPFQDDFEPVDSTPDIINNEIQIKTDEHDDAEYFQQQTISVIEDGKKIFRCKECNYKTRYPHNLRTHKTKHLSGEAAFFYCQQCPDFKTKWEITYKNHLKKKHGVHRKEVYKCTQCSFQTQAKMHFIRHCKIHSKKSFKNKLKCEYPECQFQTNCPASLNNHIILHKREHETELSKEQKSFKCTECLYETNSKTHIIKHIKSAHNNRDDTVVTVNKFKTASGYNERHFKRAHNTSHDSIVASNQLQTVLQRNENPKYIKTENSADENVVIEVSEYNENEDQMASENDTYKDNVPTDSTVETVFKYEKMQKHIENKLNISDCNVPDQVVSEIADNTFDYIEPIDIVETITECDAIQTNIKNMHNTSADTVETVLECEETQTYIKSEHNTADNNIPLNINSATALSECNKKQKDVLSKGKYLHKCSKCPYRAHNSMLMEKHEEKHKLTAAKNDSGSKVLKCQICNYVTFLPDALLKHQQSGCDPSVDAIKIEQTYDDSKSKANFDEIYIKQEFDTECAILEK